MVTPPFVTLLGTVCCEVPWHHPNLIGQPPARDAVAWRPSQNRNLFGLPLVSRSISPLQNTPKISYLSASSTEESLFFPD